MTRNISYYAYDVLLSWKLNFPNIFAILFFFLLGTIFLYTVSFSQSIKYLYFNQEPASLCFSFCFKLRDQSRRNGVNYSNFNFFFLHYRLTTMQNLSFFVLFYMQNQLVSRYFIVTTKIYLKKKSGSFLFLLFLVL